jgi:multiple sugar transport system permease protein
MVKKAATRRSANYKVAPYLFILPAIALTIVFRIIPIFYSLWLSFIKYQIINPSMSKFVGIANYAKLFRDTFIGSGLINTAYYAFGSLIPGLILSLLFAILISERWFRGGAFVRSALFVPYVLSITITGLIWSYMYQPSFGLFNYLLGQFGLPQQKWTADLNQAMPSIIAMVIWRDLGYRVTLWCAGLQSVSPEYTEAARIDGATWLQELWYIRLPLLKPVTMFLTVLGLIGSFQAFDSIYVMTMGGPANRTRVLVFHLWQTAFNKMDMGYASAIAWLLFVILITLTLIQFKLQDKEVDM